MQKSFDRKWNLKELEKQLLDHPVLQGQSLTKKSLEDVYDCMQEGVFRNLDLLPFRSKVYGDILDLETEKHKIKLELSIMEKALMKLEKLYNHPESTMTENDYFSEAEYIHQEQGRLSQRLSILESPCTVNTGMERDIAVFQKYLSSTSPLSPAEVFSNVNPLLLQEFMNRLLLQVDIYDNAVVSLFFKNGLVQKFEKKIL